jgi:homocysteine S-methyltransferase
MARHRDHLPQLDGGLFLTDGGLETTLIFHQGLELPEFAAFDLLGTDQGRQTLIDYFKLYTDIAKRGADGFVFETVTWRSNPDWGAKIGYTPETLEQANRAAAALMDMLAREFEVSGKTAVISGQIGPRHDGYNPETIMTEDAARDYHAWQIGVFAETQVDMVSALTMTNIPEAIGITKAAAQVGLPVVLSFTVETDGRLPTGGTLQAAIEEIDDKTGGYVAYYKINCAHPSHFSDMLDAGGVALKRVRALRPNASKCSHEELDNAEVLDEGDPIALGRECRALIERHPQINVLGGCCGTDHRHVGQIFQACRLAA